MKIFSNLFHQKLEVTYSLNQYDRELLEAFEFSCSHLTDEVMSLRIELKAHGEAIRDFMSAMEEFKDGDAGTYPD